MFLRNAWYVAAWDHEVTAKPLARKLLNESVVLYRGAQGRVVALEDRCRHRRMPLSAGRVIGDDIECGYHGLVYAPNGACIRVPSQSMVPPDTGVQSYPVVERHRWVWIWMGDPAAADASLIPDMFWHAHPEWVAVGDRFHVRCHYQLLIDIQLDNTHSKFVHPTSLANDGAIRTPPRVRREAAAIHGARLMPDSDPMPLFRDAGFPGNVADVWITWPCRSPATITFDAGCAVPGSGALVDGALGSDRSKAMTIFNSHGITPETERTTHHFWVSARNFAIRDDAVTRTMARIRDTFLEDVAIVEAQQRCIDEDPAAPVVDINADNPTIQARNLVARLIADERPTLAQ